MVSKQKSCPLFWVALMAFLSAAGTTFAGTDASARESALLAKADSLFTIRQFRESAAAYRELFAAGFQSPASTLRAAYLAEAAGRRDETLLYLYRFYQLTDDQAAFDKLANLAEQYGLEGYDRTDREYLAHQLSTIAPVTTQVTTALLVLGLATLYHLRRKNITRGRTTLAFTVMTLAAVLFAANNLMDPAQRAVVRNPRAITFDGPSAAADRKGLLTQGDLVEVLGDEDAWIRIRFRGKISYVRKELIERI